MPSLEDANRGIPSPSEGITPLTRHYSELGPRRETSPRRMAQSKGIQKSGREARRVELTWNRCPAILTPAHPLGPGAFRLGARPRTSCGSGLNPGEARLCCRKRSSIAGSLRLCSNPEASWLHFVTWKTLPRFLAAVGFPATNRAATRRVANGAPGMTTVSMNRTLLPGGSRPAPR